jgi:hypothetical protein
MIKFFKKFFKRRYVKFQLSLRRAGIAKTYRDEHVLEQQVCAIFRKLIKNKDSKFTIAPVSGKKYIVNKKLGIFVILDYCNLEITNHVYHYEMKLSNTDGSKLAKLFNDKVESDALSYENEIRANIQSSLNILFEKIDKDLKGL